MSQNETKPKSTVSKNELKVIGYDDKAPFGPCFIVTSPMEHILKISDTFAEMFPMLETSPTAQSLFFWDYLYLIKTS